MDPPCAVQELDQQKIMPEIQDELGLQTRNPQKITRESYWFRVYDMIFGKQTREAREIHPYYDGPLAEHLRSFTRFSELRLPGVVQQAHQNLGNTVDRHQNYDMQFGRQILQEASRAFMAEMSRLPPPNLRESQLQSLASSTRAGQDPESIVVKEEPRRMERRLSSYEPAGSQSWPVDSTHSSQPIFPATFQQHIPTRPMDPSSRSGAPIPISGPPSFGYQQQVEASTYYNYMPSDFEQVPFLASAEFGATIEDPDMYGPGSLTQNDLEGFTFVDNPPPNPEAYP
ncbi:hypothetical protein PMZ80_005365 [Knufia obscura]|uniref:Uncharacterized protein n=1 Tax=Knufia obscura TaxID=1635080 RepID=A0ABR0RRE2_9EURO|nr:hypothetical protein PMZ80_005365 [Knufia obscura]